MSDNTTHGPAPATADSRDSGKWNSLRTTTPTSSSYARPVKQPSLRFPGPWDGWPRHRAAHAEHHKATPDQAGRSSFTVGRPDSQADVLGDGQSEVRIHIQLLVEAVWSRLDGAHDAS
jgi:hypothetical protein